MANPVIQEPVLRVVGSVQSYMESSTDYIRLHVFKTLMRLLTSFAKSATVGVLFVLGLAVLLIAHDLAAVEQVADRVAVLYRGRIVESGTTRELFSAPLHPYSVIMLASAPVADPTRKSSRMEMSAWSSNTAEPHRGCRFHSRCPIVQERCRVEDPILTAIGAGHSVACHHPGELQSVPVES